MRPILRRMSSLLLISSAAASGLVAVLVLAGLVIIWAMLRMRMTEQAGRLELIQLELRQLAQQQMDPPPIVVPRDALPIPSPPPSDLAPLREEVGELRVQLAAISAKLDALSARGNDGRSPAAPLAERIAGRFAQKGYQSVKVLSDLERLGDVPTKVAVEGKKGGLTFKGFVVVDRGEIVDEKMTSSHEIFP